ncbi:Bug family tripartite tricarboxylate transporter substrate binding protein [Robertmurraya andreesenii]|uniref:Tripartite-type tricarboxylate transporter receptor subunit TctC n=1 Tax=Anoxybacillus andreesenii TaxID=1325932 RepID=A0ABT9V8B4_9BACL|nr:tripartite tricarboxylate transporter substrate binding protein [Robertmurraya andreesenii]MDQ0157184.1 tripartite-type tricarboxylate transporter receptor subunit TctC [Robertmurraya andreesenii]
MLKNRSVFRVIFTLVALFMLMIATACGSIKSNGEGKEKSINFPTKNITGVIPFGAGGPTDSMARAAAAAAEQKIGKSIIMVNKPGASGGIGTQDVYDSKADGHTLLFAAETNLTILPVFDINERSYKDFEAINIFGRTYSAIAVKADSKYNTLEDLINDAKENPGKISLTLGSSGSQSQIVATMLRETTGAEFNMIPFDGDGPALTAVLGGHVDAFISSVAMGIENVEGGKLKFLAIVHDEPIDNLPDVPPVTEAIPEMEKYLPWGPFSGVFVKKDTPDEIKQYLIEKFKEASEVQEFKDFLANSQYVPLSISGQEAEEFITDWASKTLWLLHDAGITKKSPEVLDIPKPEK